MNSDILKTLLVTDSTFYWMEMSKNLNYFKEVLSFAEFEKEVEKALNDTTHFLTDTIVLKRAYKEVRPFALLALTEVHNDKVGHKDGRYVGLAIYDPYKKVIFENQICLNLMWDGWSDQGTIFPLFNSLLDYLRQQK